MEEVEGLVIPDSYQSEEECEDLNSKVKPPSPIESINVDDENENEESKEVALEDKKNISIDEESYMLWFDAFLAKHGFDRDYLEESWVQEILKSWVQKKIISAEYRLNEGKIDVKLLNYRYAICKRWLQMEERRNGEEEEEEEEEEGSKKKMKERKNKSISSSGNIWLSPPPMISTVKFDLSNDFMCKEFSDFVYNEGVDVYLMDSDKVRYLKRMYGEVELCRTEYEYKQAKLSTKLEYLKSHYYQKFLNN